MNNIWVRKIVTFILFIAVLAGSTVLVVQEFIAWPWKFVIGILAIILSFIIFKFGVMLDKKEEKIETSNRSPRCPKCGKPYDGNECFYCGFKGEN